LSAEPEVNVAKALESISTSDTALVSEEIALVKAEVSGKVKTAGIGAGVGAAAGVFLFFAFIMFTHFLAWGIWELLGGAIAWGFFITGFLYVLIAGFMGAIAYRMLSKTKSPVPEMAIEEAKVTKQAVVDARNNA
jgi:hypothetical protein